MLMDKLIVEFVFSKKDSDYFSCVSYNFLIPNNLNELKNIVRSILMQTNLVNCIWMSHTACKASNSILNEDGYLDTVCITCSIVVLNMRWQDQQLNECLNDWCFQCSFQVEIIHNERFQDRQQDGQTRYCFFVSVQLAGMIDKISDCHY